MRFFYSKPFVLSLFVVSIFLAVMTLILFPSKSTQYEKNYVRLIDPKLLNSQQSSMNNMMQQFQSLSSPKENRIDSFMIHVGDDVESGNWQYLFSEKFRDAKKNKMKEQ